MIDAEKRTRMLHVLVPIDSVRSFDITRAPVKQSD